MLNLCNPKVVDRSVVAKYAALSQNGKSIATYIWIDGSGQNLRSKTRVFDSAPKDCSEYPVWNTDGSSCGLAEPGVKSDIFLKPVAVFKVKISFISIQKISIKKMKQKFFY